LRSVVVNVQRPQRYQEETAMTKRLATGVAVLSFVATAAVATAATSLTDAMQSTRMTVLKVDRAAGRFLCAEHRTWTAVAPGSLAGVGAGDIVRVETRGARPVHLAVLRTAAEEIASPER
jgi:hypothetical protein